jgi:hypothetical protein
MEQPQTLEPFVRHKRIDRDQVVRLGAVKPPEPIHAASPERPAVAAS